jgi:hypothetical protein
MRKLRWHIRLQLDEAQHDSPKGTVRRALFYGHIQSRRIVARLFRGWDFRAMDGKSPGLKTRATGNQWTAPSVQDTVNMQSEWSGRDRKPRGTHQRARKQIGLSNRPI